MTELPLSWWQFLLNKLLRISNILNVANAKYIVSVSAMLVKKLVKQTYIYLL